MISSGGDGDGDGHEVVVPVVDCFASAMPPETVSVFDRRTLWESTEALFC